MARTLTPIDVYAIVNAMVEEQTGQQATLQVVDTSTFISAGETLLQAGTENVLNTLALVFGRTLMAVRPYKAKLALIDAMNTGAYTSRIRKISYYSKTAQADGAHNTDLYTNLSQGYDNGTNGGSSTASMWIQNVPVPLEVYFGGQSVWQDSISIYEDQLKAAFRSEDEFARFAEGILTERGNDIESQKEAFNRALIINHAAGVIDMSADMPGSAIEMVAAYNADRGTSYNGTQLRTTYLEDFLAFFVETFKITSDRMTHRSANFHWSPPKTVGGDSYTLLRHTPKAMQRALLYNPFFIKAKANVFPQIFNPEYLEIGQYEGVDFWQNENVPYDIDVTPAIIDTSTGEIDKGAAVTGIYLLGLLYDQDALMMNYQLDDAYSTPIEARKKYRNIWWHFSRNSMADFTENCVVFYMAS